MRPSIFSAVLRYHWSDRDGFYLCIPHFGLCSLDLFAQYFSCVSVAHPEAQTLAEIDKTEDKIRNMRVGQNISRPNRPNHDR